MMSHYTKPDNIITKRERERESIRIQCASNNNICLRGSTMSAAKLHAQALAVGPHLHRRSNIAVIHGFLGSSNNWLTVGRKLANHPLVADRLHTLYALDMRNHGRSPHTPHHTNALMCSDLEQFALDHVIDHNLSSSSSVISKQKQTPERSGSSIFIGHSMGGAVVMNTLYRRWNEAALRRAFHGRSPDVAAAMDAQDNIAAMDLVPHGGSLFRESTPGHVAAAVIVDIFPTPIRHDTFDSVETDLNAMLGMDLSKIHSSAQGSEVLKQLGVTSSQMRNFLLTNLMVADAGGGLKQQPQQYKWRCNLEVLHRDFENILMSIDPDHPELSSCLTPCRTPVLFVFGSKSPYNTPQGRSRIAKYFSNVEEVEIHDAGHFVHYEKMDAFVEAVAPFLYEHMGTG